MSISSSIVVILLSLLSVELVTCEFCLFVPYITSVQVKNKESPLVQGSNSTRLTLILTLDYQTVFSIDGFGSSQTTDTDIIVFNRKLPDDNEGIKYTSFYVNGRLSTLSQSSSSWFERAKSIYKPSVERSAISLFETCSELYLFSASFARQLNSTHILHVYYHISSRCYSISRIGSDVISELRPVSKEESSALDGRIMMNVVAANFFDRYLIEIAADSMLAVSLFEPEGYPNEKNPLGITVNYGRQPITYAPFLGPTPLIKNENCKHVIDNLLPTLAEAAREDIENIKPLITFSRNQDEFLGVVYSSRTLGIIQIWRYNSRDDSYRMNLADPPLWLPIQPYGGLVALSLSNSEGHAIYLDRIENRVHYRRNFRTDDLRFPFYYQTYDRYVVPDDITHWTTCRKIVSLYGFAYTLHNYEENILEDKSYWYLLDREQFKVPIEAMHAEGDEFWFFIKAASVIVMKADSSDCSTLNFISKKIVNRQQLFKRNPRQVYLEGRYFDNTSWAPNWSYLPDTPKDWEETLFTKVWPYVLAVAVITMTLLALVIMILLKRTERMKGDNIYSKTRLSNIKSVRQPSKEMASQMPLFSQHTSVPEVNSDEPQAPESPKYKSVVKTPPKRLATKKSPSPLKSKRKSPTSPIKKKSAKTINRTNK